MFWMDERKASVMKTGRGMWLLAAGLGLTLATGCQTWPTEAGITLPSPWYLKHPPQYFPPSPPFPLQKELDSLEDAARQLYEGPGPGG
jgi:hypothetical protein